MRTEQRQEFLRDVQVRDEDAEAVRALLARRGAEDLMTMIGVEP